MLHFQNLNRETLVVARRDLYVEDSLFDFVPKGAVGTIRHRDDTFSPNETVYEVLWTVATKHRSVCRLKHSHLDPRVSFANPLSHPF